MQRRRLSGKEIAADVREGMPNTALCDKYGISEGQIKTVLRKLVSAGLLRQEDLPEKSVSLLESRTIPSVRCPNCGALQIDGDKVCADCGSPLGDDAVGQNSHSDRADPSKSGEPEDAGPAETWTCPACGVSRPEKYDECPQCGVIVTKFEEGKVKNAIAEEHVNRPVKPTIPQDNPRAFADDLRELVNRPVKLTEPTSTGISNNEYIIMFLSRKGLDTLGGFLQTPKNAAVMAVVVVSVLIAIFVVGHKGNYELTKVLLDEGFADVHERNKYGYTALMSASRAGHIEGLKVLLANGADINARTPIAWATALYCASDKGHTEIVKVLLANGADINARTRDGWTALIQASKEGHTEVVKTLLESGADINARTQDGLAALMSASTYGHTEIVKVLLANGADINARTNNGYTALMSTSFKGDTEIVKVLLANGADINARTNNGNTALILNSLEGQFETVKILIERGAHINAKDNHGSTALTAASYGGYTRIVALLLANGAK